jgi:hypothetical protein
LQTANGSIGFGVVRALDTDPSLNPTWVVFQGGDSSSGVRSTCNLRLPGRFALVADYGKL